MSRRKVLEVQQKKGREREGSLHLCNYLASFLVTTSFALSIFWQDGTVVPPDNSKLLKRLTTGVIFLIFHGLKSLPQNMVFYGSEIFTTKYFFCGFTIRSNCANNATLRTCAPG